MTPAWDIIQMPCSARTMCSPNQFPRSGMSKALIGFVKNCLFPANRNIGVTVEYISYRSRTKNFGPLI